MATAFKHRLGSARAQTERLGSLAAAIQGQLKRPEVFPKEGNDPIRRAPEVRSETAATAAFPSGLAKSADTPASPRSSKGGEAFHKRQSPGIIDDIGQEASYVPMELVSAPGAPSQQYAGCAHQIAETCNSAPGKTLGNSAIESPQTTGTADAALILPESAVAQAKNSAQKAKEHRVGSDGDCGKLEVSDKSSQETRQGRRRVTFAPGPLGHVYGTEDGHPDCEGRTARPNPVALSALTVPASAAPSPFTASNLEALRSILGPECRPSLERLQRRLDATTKPGGGRAPRRIRGLHTQVAPDGPPCQLQPGEMGTGHLVDFNDIKADERPCKRSRCEDPCPPKKHLQQRFGEEQAGDGGSRSETRQGAGGCGPMQTN